jgi:FHA domain-containing protein
MIKISVISYNNEKPIQPISAVFGPEGASIGRTDDNFLILQDQKRYISRVQASVKSDGGRHTIVNLSQANPIIVNGEEIIWEQEADLHFGDEIQIGLYLLRAESVSETSNSNAAVNTKNNAKNSEYSTPSNYSSTPPNDRELGQASTHLATEEILSESLNIALTEQQNSAIIPDDFDPLAMPVKNPSNPIDLFATIEYRSAASASKAGTIAMPYETISSIIESNSPSSVEPQALICSQSASALVATDAAITRSLHSNDETSKSAVPTHNHFAVSAASEGTTGLPNQNSVDALALVRAFLSGANLPPDTISSGVTPEWMEMMGRFVATTTQGTIDLISSRAMVKREVKADLTMIVARKNNPLKFLPNGESALIQMFGRKIPGFMDPIESLQDAYLDLRAHQIGVVAGMRAALDEIFKRFDPELLEQKLKSPMFLDNFLTANRKAKMWDMYAELFSDLQIAAQDDFHTLFGKAFLAAYEHEIERFTKEACHA